MATQGYAKKLNKTIRINTNDPKQPQHQFKISGTVKKFVTVTPSRVRLSGIIGEPISKTVLIIPETEVPFNIMKITHMGAKNFSYKYKEVEHEGKKAYELTVSNTKTDVGRYHEQLIVLTDVSGRTPLTILVDGFIRSPADPVIEEPTSDPGPANKQRMIIKPPTAPIVIQKQEQGTIPPAEPEPATQPEPAAEPETDNP